MENPIPITTLWLDGELDRYLESHWISPVYWSMDNLYDVRKYDNRACILVIPANGKPYGYLPGLRLGSGNPKHVKMSVHMHRCLFESLPEHARLWALLAM